MLQRKCIVTNEVKNVDEMIRIVRTKEGKYHVNSDAKGRGAYVTKDASYAEKIVKTRLLNRAFKEKVDKEVYDELITLIKED